MLSIILWLYSEMDRIGSVKVSDLTTAVVMLPWLFRKHKNKQLWSIATLKLFPLIMIHLTNYILNPLQKEHVNNIMKKRKPLGAILQFGGQSPLKLSHDISPILGTDPTAIDICEDRNASMH